MNITYDIKSYNGIDTDENITPETSRQKSKQRINEIKQELKGLELARAILVQNRLEHPNDADRWDFYPQKQK